MLLRKSGTAYEYLRGSDALVVVRTRRSGAPFKVRDRNFKRAWDNVWDTRLILWQGVRVKIIYLLSYFIH
jgi:hypothetical protein